MGETEAAEAEAEVVVEGERRLVRSIWLHDLSTCSFHRHPQSAPALFGIQERA
jgi:hypothetical protein